MTITAIASSTELQTHLGSRTDTCPTHRHYDDIYRRIAVLCGTPGQLVRASECSSTEYDYRSTFKILRQLSAA